MLCEKASKKKNKKLFSLDLHLFIAYFCSINAPLAHELFK